LLPNAARSGCVFFVSDADRLDQLRRQLDKLRDEVDRIADEIDRIESEKPQTTDSTTRARSHHPASKRPKSALTENELEAEADRLIGQFGGDNTTPVSKLGCWTVFIIALLCSGIVLTALIFQHYR
jgi:hypothetical protein